MCITYAKALKNCSHVTRQLCQILQDSGNKFSIVYDTYKSLACISIKVFVDVRTGAAGILRLFQFNTKPFTGDGLNLVGKFKCKM